MTKKPSKITDEMILERAQVIAAETGLKLVDAMLQAEEDLTPRNEIPKSFTCEIFLKPRIARWVVATFGGHAKFSIEERLGAHVAVGLTRDRVSSRRFAQAAPSIVEGEAVTLRRDQMAKVSME